MKQNKKIAFTLAKGATHITTCGNNKKFAFTLAEVLITLGIIGVVAAMTMPSLITNYKKKQTVTQLKATYSILAQAFERAKADNGDISNWGIDTVYGATSGEQEITQNFINNFFIPYIKPPLKNYNWTSYKQIKYDGPYYLGKTLDDGQNRVNRYILTLANGSMAAFSLDSTCDDEKLDENGKYVSCNTQRYYTSVYIIVDTNGFKLPNTYGKDVFVLSLDLQTNIFEFYNYARSKNNRVWLLNACSKNSKENRHCGRLIQLDGWEINYNW